MYKLLVLDFDDTLLKSDLSISNANQEAIKKAKEQGVNPIFIESCRHLTWNLSDSNPRC